MTAASDGTDWRSLARCRNLDPDLFFPIGSTGPAVGQIGEALAVCRKCMVSDACLDWAIEHRQEAGIWGGTTEDQRRRMLRRRPVSR